MLSAPSSPSSLPLVYIYPAADALLLPAYAPGSDFRLNDMRIDWRICYATEWVLPLSWRKMGLVTDDPSQASLFLIPHTSTAQMHECFAARELGITGGVDVPCNKQAGHKLAAILDHVVEDFPFWNASGGRDHAVILSHDGGLAWINVETGMGVDLLTRFRNTTFLQNLGSRRSVWYSPSHDIVTMPVAVPTGAVPLDDADAVPFPAPLAYFSGGLHGRHRTEIFNAVANDTDITFLTKRDPHYYGANLRSHRFCLHLPGFAAVAWSGRIAHILQAGCVPVVIIDELDLPFQRVLDWRSFSVRIDEETASVPGELGRILRAIPEAQWRSMRRKLLRLLPLLSYPTLKPTSVNPFTLGSSVLEEGESASRESPPIDASLLTYAELVLKVHAKPVVEAALAAVGKATSGGG
jgi:hypothetical protein